MLSRKGYSSEKNPDIPEKIYDADRKRTFFRGRFLGKGGFARCHEVIDRDSQETLACKVVDKEIIKKPHHREKMAQEIEIHRRLHHDNVVAFHGCFEDKKFIYILLELCSNHSLMEMHKRRKVLSEPEVRYFTRQIILGCIYLHSCKIVHRDLKLGNLLISESMEIKLADFGLATRLNEHQKRTTLCGTPNYIAPEILNRDGHGYEADVWSLGCIVYTLLLGRPPFETQSLKDTYDRIKSGEYNLPPRLPEAAQEFIINCLKVNPKDRPTMMELLKFDFFNAGYLPSVLPQSCLTMAPRFNNVPPMSPSKRARGLPDYLVDQLTSKEEAETEVPPDFWLSNLRQQLLDLLKKMPVVSDGMHPDMDVAEDPKSAPLTWVCKWVDYSDKYGLGYQLKDNSIGVLFNDSTKLLAMSKNNQLQFIDRDGSELYFGATDFQPRLRKKVTLINYFRNYMKDHLLEAGVKDEDKEATKIARLPWLRTWFRTRSAINLQLTNGTVQINFFKDHIKIVLCPLMSCVTLMFPGKEPRTFRFDKLEQSGVTESLRKRLVYAANMCERMENHKITGSCKLRLSNADDSIGFNTPKACK